MGRTGTALCTAVYPGVEPWLPELCASIERQTARDFDPIVILDGVSERTWLDLGGRALAAKLLRAPEGATPADVRNSLLAAACSSHDRLVLVDADDVLLPDRVAAARTALESADVVGCAMDLTDPAGNPLGLTFGAGMATVDDAHIFESNLFGLGNTAWRAEALAPCLPAPATCKAVDWFLATRARLQGRTFRFDPVSHMRYRQHPNNLAGVLPPFSPERLERGAQLASEHFALVLALGEAGPGSRHRERLLAASQRVARFMEKAHAHPEWLSRVALERSRKGPLEAWWAFLAVPMEEE